MKKAKLAASLIAVSMAATTLLTGCNNDSNPNSNSGNSSTPGGSTSGTGESTPGNTSDPGTPSNPSQATNLPFNLKYADGTTIRIAAGYQKKNTAITFDADTVKTGVTLSDGKTYQAGDLKPTWAALSETLKVNFQDKYTGSDKVQAEWTYWREQLDQVDIICGTAKDLNDVGPKGTLVDLSKYLDDMPNFKAYLEANPIVRMSITGYKEDNTTLGAIYFAPYFDGVNDIERMPLMRTDWVEKLLNGSGDFTAENSGNTAAPVYTAYMPTSGTIDIEVVKKDGSGTETIKKDCSKNIIEQMKAKGAMTGVEAVNMLRKYIDEAYSGYYGNDRADLFVGQNAAWDADELVALLRCVVSNAQTLNGTDTVAGIFSREDSTMSRRVDMYKLAGMMFGARGLESRQDYLYIGNDKKLHDARQEPATYKALEKMNEMAQEGLINKGFLNNADDTSKKMIQNDAGFMSYDYNQTQTLFNEQADVMSAGEEYRAVMVPVAIWYDDDTNTPKYMRFTESWRSVKDSGWAIPASTESNTDVLNACLHLFDYAFSADGQILMSYGPDSFIDVKNANGTTIAEKYNTFNMNGVEMPKISAGCREDLWKYESGNYTNFARRYLGSTLHFVKSQAFEVECTTDAGKKGAQMISNAIGFGTIKHPELSTSIANPWYISVPTTLPQTNEDIAKLGTYPELSTNGMFSTGNGTNVFLNLIVDGYKGKDVPGSNAEEAAKKVADDWHGKDYLEVKGYGWQDILEFNG